MKTVSYDSFYKYFSNLITSYSKELHDNNEISQDLVFKFYPTTGEYFRELEDGKESPSTVLVNILNGGGVQDSGVAVDTYLQIISFEFLALDSQRDDIMYLLTNLIANYKNKIESLPYIEDARDQAGQVIAELSRTATINISVEDFPEYSEKFDVHGEEKFTASFTANIIVLPTVQLANGYKILLNGIDIPYTNLIIDRNVELTPDLIKRDTSKFFANTTGLAISLAGYYVSNNSELSNLLSDCCSNVFFNEVYTLQINRPDGTPLLNDSFKVKQSRFNFTYGSIVAWSATFYPGTTV